MGTPPAQTMSTQSEWQITSLSNLDMMLLVAFAVVAVGAVWWTWRSLDPRNAVTARVGVVILRLLILLMGFAILLQPTLHRRELKSEPARLAILVDTSLSMTQGPEPTRLSRAKRLLGSAARSIGQLAKRYHIDWYVFSDAFTPVSGPDRIAANPTAKKRTDVRGALRSLTEKDKDLPVDGIVLISDGADTEIFPDADGEWNLEWAETLGIPVNTIAVGDSPNRVDLAITQVEAAPFAFSRNRTPITVALRSVGLTDRRVEAFLSQEGTVVQRREVQMVGGRGQLTFTPLPTVLGQQVMEVSVPVPSGDSVPENNRQYVSFEVIRDKFRILHLAGRPSWDQRFLRDTLKAWPKVDLVSFYVLRNAYQSSSEGSGGVALIPFPTDDLFKDHLSEFDILVFHEFEPAEVGIQAYADKIAAFVKQGGALVLIGGDRGLKGGTLGGKALESILPVELLPLGTPVSRMTEMTEFRARLTESGASHPLTRLVPRADENRQLWRSLSRLDGVGRVAKLSTGAYSLLEHPFVQADDGPMPVIAIKEVEKGRTLAITTDSLWRWRFTGPMTGGPISAYNDFWRKAVAWLTHAPDLTRLRLAVSPSPVVVGTPAQIAIEILDESYKPIPGEAISTTITSFTRDGRRSITSFDAKVDTNGKYVKKWTPEAEGSHTVSVTSENGLSNAQRFLVVTDDRERAHMDLQESLLAALAKATDGAFTRNTFDASGIAVNSAKGREVVYQLAFSLWDHPMLIAFFLLVLFSEWLLRKRMGIL